ncbi:VCBS repeat-containing protein [Corallococcus aberystwythensis]|uniref:VCBS repeat-containing protein n=1 Tax=Corallococcus aberystwythensis TaxID=2316722 RepID=A0A3A8QXB1_9BACT|nr:VCBS repeat-containing protein [Corallococcus aberystwythensis]
MLVGEQPFESPEAQPGAREGPAPRTVHTYGKRVHIIGSTSPRALQLPMPASVYPNASEVPRELTGTLDRVESLGLAALRLRQSSAYQTAKQQRPRQGQPWNMRGNCTDVAPIDRQRTAEAAALKAGAPWSAFMAGSAAVGLVIVSGPTPELQFSNDELIKVVAEVQNGLSWFPTVSPAAQLSFTYDIQHVRIPTPADPNAADLEAAWRDPAMAALGYSASFDGVIQYIEALRVRFGTRWTYCGFFTKYPLWWFAYASLGGPRLVMQYDNDGWGPDNIDRVFAHETGHIFRAPDEYGSCGCGGAWGRYGAPNDNCEACAPAGGVACLMKGNAFEMCDYTPLHVGFPAPWTLMQTDACTRLGNLSAAGRSQVLLRTQAAGEQRAATLRQVTGGAGLEVGWSAIHSLPGWEWPMEASDVWLALGDISGDGKPEALIQRRSGQPALALVSYAEEIGGPSVSWRVQGEIPGGWRMNTSDVYLPLGDIDGDGKTEVLVRSQYAGDCFLGLLRYDPGQGGLRAVWIVHTTLPGGWKMNQSDAWLAAGDLDGNGRTDLIVRSQYDGDRYLGVVRYDPATQGLRAAWIVKNELPGGWKMNTSDVYLFAGDLDGDGRSELIVRSQYAGDRYVGLLRDDPGTHGIKADGILQNTLPGGWTMNTRDAWLLAGDLDANGRTELVVRNQDTGNRYLGVVRYDPGTRRLKAVWIAENTLPGGWRMNTSDAYLLAGDVDGNGRTDLIVRSQYPGDRYLGVLRYDAGSGGLRAAWIIQNVIPGSLEAAPGQLARPAALHVPPGVDTPQPQPRPHA